MRFPKLVVFLVLSSTFAYSVVGEEVLDLDVEQKKDDTQAGDGTAEQIPTASNGTAATSDVPENDVEPTPNEGVASANVDSVTEGVDGKSEIAPSESHTAGDAMSENEERESSEGAKPENPPVQTGPFVDLLGPTLLSLHMVDGSHAQLRANYTNDALRGKKVVGLYFSADWCNPCRQFTPDLVSFYNKMNSRRGRAGEFEIVWISRCRDQQSFNQYFLQMNWLALPADQAMGQRGKSLSDKYRVKGIPSLVLLDEVGSVITTDARNKIPVDKAGIGFPWRNPLATLYVTIFPRSLRMMLRSQIASAKQKIGSSIKGVFRKKKAIA